MRVIACLDSVVLGALLVFLLNADCFEAIQGAGEEVLPTFGFLC